MDTEPTKWWGWGLASRSFDVESRPELLRFLAERLGLQEGTRRPAVPLRDVTLPPSRLGPDRLAALAEIVGTDRVRTDLETRIRRSTGKSYRDLVALRTGRIPRAPDAVVLPANEADVVAVVAHAANSDLCIVPFGGGTSVVGGVEPPAEDPRPVLTLDLSRMHRLVALDDFSLTATAEAGILGPDLEDALRSAGYTLGHFPQSFEFSTLGGWAATRGAGALSNLYGKIEDAVTRVRMVHPGGILETRRVPATAAGPSLKDLVLGSEGVLGVITQVGVRIRPVPTSQSFATYYFRSFNDGVEALRRMAQAGPLPAMTYLSDEPETELGSTMAAPPLWTLAGVLERLGGHRPPSGCVLNLAYEGTDEQAQSQRRNARAACGSATFLGAHPARKLATQRYDTPYLRDSLLDHGVLIETVETATTWSALIGLYHGARDGLVRAIRDEGLKGTVLCHVSHVYPDGASLYFTFLTPQKEGDEIGQWRRLKTAVTTAIVEHDGTITHHHGVGVDHRPWVEREWGPSGVLALRALKERLDPTNIMNPGKLLP